MKNNLKQDNISNSLVKINLDEQCEEINKEQFYTENENEDGVQEIISDGKEVLKSLQNLKNNPKLFDYVIKCLSKEGIYLKDKYFSVVVEKPIYDNNPNSELTLLRMKENNPKLTLKIILPFMFKNIDKIDKWLKDINNFSDKRIHFDHKAFMQGLKMNDLLFEKYSIREIGKL